MYSPAPRGRPRQSDAAKKMRKRLEQRERRKRIVNIGQEIGRWKEIKNENGLKSDAEVAKFLIDRYRQMEHESIRSKISSTPIVTTHVQSEWSGRLSTLTNICDGSSKAKQAPCSQAKKQTKERQTLYFEGARVTGSQTGRQTKGSQTLYFEGARVTGSQTGRQTKESQTKFLDQAREIGKPFIQSGAVQAEGSQARKQTIVSLSEYLARVTSKPSKLYLEQARCNVNGETTTSSYSLPTAPHISHSPASAISGCDVDVNPGDTNDSHAENAFTGTTRIYIKPEPDNEQFLVKVESDEFQNAYKSMDESPEATSLSHKVTESERESAGETSTEEDAVEEFVNFFKKDKTLQLDEELEDETGNCNRRRSQRMRKKGYRVNYAAVEWNDSSSNEEADGETKSELDTDVDVESTDSGIVGADCTNNSEQKDVKNKFKKHDNKIIKSKSVKQKRAHENDDPDFELTDEEDMKRTSVKRKTTSENEASDFELTDENDDSDIDVTDEEVLNQSENTSLKPKCKKIRTGFNNNLKKKKSNNKKDDKKPWVKVSLSDHRDKYEIEKIKSFEQQHRKNDVNEEVFSCLVCKHFKCSAKDAFENHLEQHINKTLECPYCQYSAFNRGDLSNHRSQCFDTCQALICHICGELSRTIEAQKNHFGNVHNIPKWKCFLCGELFTSLQKRKAHHKEAHPDFYSQCPSCKKVLVSRIEDDFQKHVEKCKQKTPCEICGELYYPNQLARHLSRHRGARTFSCDQCPYIAKSRSRLRTHLLAHKGEHPYKCDQCKFSCVQRTNLKYHMRTHSGERPFKCTQCKYAARWNVQLRDHLKLHSNPDGTKMCELCNVLFKNERVLGQHLTKEHNDLK